MEDFELLDKRGRITGPGGNKPLQQYGRGDEVLRSGTTVQLILERGFNLAFQVRPDVIPVGDIPNSGQGFGALKVRRGRREPG